MAAIAFGALHGSAFGEERAALDPDAGSIKRAVFANDALWLLTDDGRLSELVPDKGKRTEVTALGPVADICSSGGGLSALVQKKDHADRFTIFEFTIDGQWADVLNGLLFIDRPEGGPQAMLCPRDGEPVIVTREEMTHVGTDYFHMAALWRQKLKPALDKKFMPGPVLITAARDDGDATLVGYTQGEWGGGILRIDRRTGEVRNAQTLSDRQLKKLHDGSAPMPGDDSAKDVWLGNVNGIEPEPDKPGCFIVAQGLVHFMPDGELDELCHGKLKRLYSKRFERSTVAFFGLANIGGEIWAVGIDGLYRMKRDGTVDFKPRPEFHNVGGVWVNFDDPRFVLVMTEINRRNSLSGATPLLVPR
ncbi:MAG TPA: hypothetical protein VGL66_01860 [Caulobacteraceae bacterium]